MSTTKTQVMKPEKEPIEQVRFTMFIFIHVISLIVAVMPGCSRNKDGDKAAAELPAPPAPPSTPQEGHAVYPDTFTEVEIMPVFEGGDSALLKFLMENIKYPESAKTAGIQGKVFIGFVVEADGSVGRARILKGVDPDLDAEALRVVRLLPRFEPGRNEGRVVAVCYTVPIAFTLR
jgi:TonB family protein